MNKNKEASARSFEKEITTLWKKSSPSKRREILVFFNQRIAFLQHERLVHLFVMLFFSGASLFLGWAIQGSDSLFLPFIFLLILIVTIFFVSHYYFLENTCQKWGRLSIEMEKELLAGKK
jgi:hypothetical protein